MSTVSPLRYLKSAANLYVSKNIMLWLFIVSLSLMVIIGLFDALETLRRVMAVSEATLGFVLELTLLRLPQHILELLPFIIFLASLIALWRLNQVQEITALRAAGISGGQIALGVFITALIIGTFSVFLLNPIAAVMNTRHATLEERVLKGNHQRLSISSTGFWLKETEGTSKTIFHAEAFSLNDRTFKHVTFYEFDLNDRFLKRIDAINAKLLDEKWVLTNAREWNEGITLKTYNELHRPTTLTLEKIQRSTIQPHQMPFWRIPAFIRQLQKNGMSSLIYEVYWHRLWAEIVLLGVMAVLAVGFCLPNPRHYATGRLIGVALICGFIIHFFNNIIQAFGQADRLPAFFAAWIPPVVTGLLGIGYLMHAEESA